MTIENQYLNVINHSNKLIPKHRIHNKLLTKVIVYVNNKSSRSPRR